MKPRSVLDWVGPLLLVVLFIAYLFFSTPSEVVLCRGNDDCFRDWVGALSGWGAVGAAIWTVRFLSKQVSDADRHHRENAMIALRRKRSICSRVVQLADEYWEFVKGSEEGWKSATDGRMGFTQERSDIEIELSVLQSIVNDEAFAAFEAEIELLDISSVRAKARVERAIEALKKMPETVMSPEMGGFAYRMIDCYDSVDRLHDDAGQRAGKFLKETAHLVAVPPQ